METNRPPGPRSNLLGTRFFKFRRDPLGFFQSINRQYGDIAHFRLGPQEVFLINDPEIIRDILVTHHAGFIKGRALQRSRRLLGEGLLTAEGEHHRRQRRLVQPAFHRQRIASYCASMTSYAASLADRWHDGATLDIAQEMTRLTLEIVAKTLFDAGVGSAEAAEIGGALTAIMESFEAMLLPFSELLEKLPGLPRNRRFEKARQSLDSMIHGLINKRRRSATDRGDLLSMLLAARDEEGDGTGMSDAQVRDEALTIFLAGHETTANALAWTWYLLSENPDAEAALHRELDRVLGGRLPTFEDVPQLKYTEMVMAESMRLYPPAWALGRQAAEPYSMNGYTVPAGALVLMCQYLMHRDERYYDDPLRFDPERWQPAARAARPAFCYFPFGGGPRRCIGESFAWIEGILVIATIAQRWRLRLEPSHRVELWPVITLRPRYGMRMRLSRR